MNVRCEFVPDGKRAMVCAKCGRRVRVRFPDLPPAKYVARCRTAPKPAGKPTPTIIAGGAPQSTCPRLGEVVGETLLYGCGCGSSKVNGVAVSVFSCSLQGRASIAANGTHLADATIQRCVECAERPL